MKDFERKLMMAEYKLNHIMPRRDGESADALYNRLQCFFGCNACEDYGDNGCGCWQLGGYEWNSEEKDGMGEPEEWVNEEWSCPNIERKIDYEQMCAQRKSATLVFSAAIKEALRLCPGEKAKSDSYGDIVRSAAAVAVAAIGVCEEDK